MTSLSCSVAPSPGLQFYSLPPIALWGLFPKLAVALCGPYMMVMRQGYSILRSILRSPLFLGNCHFGLQHKRPTQGTGCETKCCLSMTNSFLCLGVVVCGTCHEGLRLKLHVNFQRMTSSPWSQNMIPDGHWFAGQERKLRLRSVPPLFTRHRQHAALLGSHARPAAGCGTSTPTGQDALLRLQQRKEHSDQLCHGLSRSLASKRHPKGPCRHNYAILRA